VGVNYDAVVVPESCQHVVYRDVGWQFSRRLRTLRHDRVRAVAGTEREEAKTLGRIARKVAHASVRPFDKHRAENGALTQPD